MSPSSWRPPTGDDDPVLSPRQMRWAPFVLVGLLLAALAVSAAPRCNAAEPPPAPAEFAPPLPERPRMVRVPDSGGS